MCINYIDDVFNLGLPKKKKNKGKRLAEGSGAESTSNSTDERTDDSTDKISKIFCGFYI